MPEGAVEATVKVQRDRYLQHEHRWDMTRHRDGLQAGRGMVGAKDGGTYIDAGLIFTVVQLVRGAALAATFTQLPRCNVAFKASRQAIVDCTWTWALRCGDLLQTVPTSSYVTGAARGGLLRGGIRNEEHEN